MSFECEPDAFCRRDDYSRSRSHNIAGGWGHCVARGDVGAACFLEASGHSRGECFTGAPPRAEKIGVGAALPIGYLWYFGGPH